ncbi:AMP-binding protein [Patescibacteria group bacterium]|nr:AMP-binding protein [Patescibacteria group bacterium]MBU1890062.1 AMP-binding protein [Patescibacteria group bacterium]
MYEHWNKLTKYPKEKIQALQNKKLKSFIRHFVPYSPYYRELFKKSDLSPADIITTDDLVKLPFTSKADLAPTEEDRARPRQFILQPDEKLIKKYATKGQLLKIAWSKITGQDVQRKLEWEFKPVHTHFTTGRSALPTAFTYSAYDLEIMKESGDRMFGVINVDRSLVAINGFPYSPHLAFWLAHYALVKLGITSLQTGGGKVMGTQKIMDAIEGLKAGIIIFIPGYCYHVLREAVKEQRDFSNVKHVIFGGERVSPGHREKVKELLKKLGAQDSSIYTTYAMTEGKTAWIQCCEESGYHLYPDLEYFEVVNKEGKRVPEGEPGELVYSALDWRGSIVLRYRTGDMTQGIEYQPCPYCGRTVPRIRPDIQRTSEIKEFNLTKVKGELVNLNNFFPLLSGIKELEEWQVTIQKKDNDPYEVDELICEVAVKPYVDFEQFKTRLERMIYGDVGVAVAVRQCDLDTLLSKVGMETELKDKRIIDARPK